MVHQGFFNRMEFLCKRFVHSGCYDSSPWIFFSIRWFLPSRTCVRFSSHDLQDSPSLSLHLVFSGTCIKIEEMHDDDDESDLFSCMEKGFLDAQILMWLLMPGIAYSYSYCTRTCTVLVPWDINLIIIGPRRRCRSSCHARTTPHIASRNVIGMRACGSE